MAQPLSEVAGNVEVLEAGDEGKKKSKFKAFKSFFGKKKKKEPEDAQGGRRLKPSLSSGNINVSSLKPVLAGQLPEIRPKSNMGMKALSHDSIFMLEPEHERSASKMSSSPGPQRGRTLQMPPLRPRKPSISPPLIRSDTISKDFEEISVDDGSPTSSQKKASSRKILKVRKSASETSSGLIRSPSVTTLASSSSTQLSVGFSTPATSQGCLDSSAARHKMALNPRKQKIKKKLQATVKPRQEEPSLPLASEEEKSTTQPEETNQKKTKKDSAGPSSQEQSHKTEIYAKKTTDQASNTDASGSQGYPVSAAHGRKRGRKRSSTSGMSECGSKGRRLKKSGQGRGLDRSGSPSPEKTARDCPLWHLPLEKQVMEQPTTPEAETATPQELLSAGIDDKARKASSAPQPIPEDMRESMVSGPPPNNEDRASGAENTEARASLLPVVESPSTTQEDVIPPVRLEAQAVMDPSPIQSEGEAASSLDSQNAQFKMESAQDTPTICKEKPPGNVLQAFTASTADTASARADRGISAERLPPRSLFQALERPEDYQQVSDSESTSEEESDSEEQLAPGHSFQSLEKPEDEQEVSSESESLAGESSSSGQQMALRHLSQALGKAEDKQEASSDSESTSEEGTSSEEGTGSEEQLAPRCLSEALGEPENEEVSTGSNSYVEKYNSAEDWSSSEEDLPPTHPSQALGKPEDQREVASVSENTPEEWSVSVEQRPPKCPSQPFMRPVVQQQVLSGSVSASAEWSGSVEPMSSSCPSQPWLSPKFKQQVSAGPESTTVEWDIPMEPLPPRVSSKRQRRPKVGKQVFSDPESATVKEIISREPMPLMRPVVEQEVSVGPEITAAEGSSSVQELSTSCPSQPLVRPAVEQQVSLGAESVATEERISMEPLPSRRTFQPRMSPKVKQQVSAFPESTVVEGSISMEHLPPKLFSQSLMNLKVEQKVFAGSEGVAAERIISVEPLPPRYSSQSLPNPKVQQIFLESTAVEEGISVEPLPPGCTFQPSMRPKFQPRIITLDSMSASAEWSSSVESVLPRHPFQSCVRPKFKQQVSAGPESAAFEGNVSMESLSSRHHSQTLMKPIGKQEVSSGSVSASAECSDSVEPVPPRRPSQPWVSPKFEQQVSTGPESTAVEGGISTEQLPSRHPSLSIVRQKVQQISSSFESAAAIEGGISGKPLPPKYPTQFLMRSKVQEMSSHLENTAVEEDISKKSLLSGRPSQSFVKFMAQQVFSGSESPAVAGGSYVDPLPPNHSSKSLLKPKVEHQVFSGSESADIEEGISMKPMPMKRRLQSLERPKDRQEVSSDSENTPEKWSSSKEQLRPRHLSQALGKPEHQREISVSKSFLEEGRSSEEKLPSRHPFQATDSQPQISSTGSVNVPVECSSDPEEQQQSATAEVSSFESDTGSRSLPRAPVSPNKTKRHSQSSEDLIKSLSTKPVKFIAAPAQQTSISGGLYSKKEVLERGEQNDNKLSSSPASEADIENLFGVKLRRIPSSQKYKSEKQGEFTKLPTSPLDPTSSSKGREYQIRRTASLGRLGTSDNLTRMADLAEKQQVGPKSEGITKKQPAYKIPEKPPRRQSDYATSEPTWITMVKQRQKTSQAHVPMKELNTKKGDGAKAKTKETRYGGANPANENRRKIFVSNVYRQEKMAQTKLPKSTKAVEDQKMVQVPAMEKEIKRSATLPAVLQEPAEPAEPVWFSLAKKKAKAWSHIAEIMQ
ncbi:acrosomal protein KIAA1210 homolog [Dugong dugon]